MEQRALKTTVQVKETVFSDAAEQAVDIDFSLPDYCPDISKIFKCRAVPRVSSKGINGKTVNIECSVCINLLYSDKDGNICAYEHIYPFVKNIEMPEEADGANICCRAKCEYVNCRAVTGRKIDIHGAVGLNVKVFRRKSTDVISDYDDSETELRRTIAPTTVPMGYAEKYLIAEETIRIGQGRPPIKGLLRYDATASVNDTKLIEGKAVVKGEITLNLLYCPENGSNPQCVRSVIPFSQIVEVEGMTDSCRCDTRAEIVFSELKPQMSSGMPADCFAFSAKLLISCEAFCTGETAVVSDAFSRRYKADISRSRVSLEKINTSINEIHRCKKSVELEESISSVIDLWCGVQSYKTKFDGENIFINGTVTVGMILCSEKGNAIYGESATDFECKYPVKSGGGVLHAEPQTEVRSCSYTIADSNRIELQAELGINATVYERNEMLLVSDISIDTESRVQPRGRMAMAVYFSGENECVWDVARKYNAAVEEIMQINGLEEDCLPSGKMLLVPVS